LKIIIDLSLCEILPVYLADRLCQLQLPATNTACLIRFWSHRKLITVCGKFVVVSELRNLRKFAMENCGP